MAESFDKEFGAGDLARMLGMDEASSAKSWQRMRTDPAAIRYRELTPTEDAQLRGRVAEHLTTAEPPAAGAQAQARWEAGWAEVLDRVRSLVPAPENLKPQYIRHRMMRLNGRYIRAENADFEYRVHEAIKAALFDKYLSGVERIMEIGCGTGQNLASLDRQFSGIELIGLDWARPALELVELIAAQRTNPQGTNPMSAQSFNMLTQEGAEEISITPQTALITLHSLEQLGTGFGPLLNYMLGHKPALCLHLEPIHEFYDPDSEFDRAAIDYHHKRNYLIGFHNALVEHEEAGDLSIKEARRLNFGSTYHEAYSLIIWRPAGAGSE